MAIVIAILALLLLAAAGVIYAFMRKSSSENAKLAPSARPVESQKPKLKKKEKKEEAKRAAVSVLPQDMAEARLVSVVRGNIFVPSDAASFVKGSDGTLAFTLPEKYKCMRIPSDNLHKAGEIGAGSFAVVYKASLRGWTGLVAWKVAHRQQGGQREKFMGEIKLLSTLSHPCTFWAPSDPAF